MPFSGLQMVREIPHVGDYRLEVHHLNAQIVLLVQIPYLVITIMTWDDQHLGTGFSDLVRLDLAGCHPPSLVLRPHGDVTTSAATTVIILTVDGHVAKVRTEFIHEEPRFFPKSSASGNIARILIGDGFGYLLGRINLYLAFFDIIVENLHTVNDGKRRLTTG